MNLTLENLFIVISGAPTWVAGITVVYFSFTFLPWAQKRRVQKKSISITQYLFETKGLLVSLCVDVFCFFYFVNVLNIRVQSNDSIWSNLLAFLVTLIWFDFWFYSTHRLFHSRLLYRFHHQHHRSTVTNPITAHSFSALERVGINIGLMIPAYCWNFFGPMPLWGFISYQLALTLINAYGHSNVELLPKSALKYWPFNALTTPTSHSLHHLMQNRNFCLVFKVWDRIFGTFADESELAKFQISNVSPDSSRIAK